MTLHEKFLLVVQAEVIVYCIAHLRGGDFAAGAIEYACNVTDKELQLAIDGGEDIASVADAYVRAQAGERDWPDFLPYRPRG